MSAPLGAALLADMEHNPEPWKPSLALPCEHCGARGLHRPHVHGQPAPEGWRVLCCTHVDLFMALAALSVEEPERSDGLVSWAEAHRAQCGPRAAREALNVPAVTR